MTDDPDDKIVSLVARLQACDVQHMNRIHNVQSTLAKAIQTMRDDGATSEEIAGVLRHAADALLGHEPK